MIPKVVSHEISRAVKRSISPPPAHEVRVKF